LTSSARSGASRSLALLQAGYINLAIVGLDGPFDAGIAGILRNSQDDPKLHQGGHAVIYCVGRQSAQLHKLALADPVGALVPAKGLAADDQRALELVSAQVAL
jgi:hypothetical protein